MTRVSAVAVQEDVRQRLVDGLAEAITAKGYKDVTVADVVRNARTSRRTFYEHFTSRDDCFIALMFDRNTRMAEHIAAGVDPESPWHHQVRQAVEAWIAAATEEPAITLSWIRDAPALGVTARDLQRGIQQSFVELVENLADNPRMRADDIAPLTPGLAILLVGGLRELVATQVESGGELADIVDTAVAATTALLRAERP